MFWSRNKRRTALRRDKRTFKKKFLLILPVLILAIVFFVINSNFLKIQNLEIHKEYIDCASDQQLDEKINVKGLNIFFVDTNTVSKNLQANFQCIKKINVTKKYPNSLQVNVSGRVPVLRVATIYEQHATMSASLEEIIEEIASPSAISSQSASPTNVLTNDFVIDQEGEIFATWEQEDLPKILYLSDEIINVGKRLDKSLVENLIILFEKLRIFNVDYREVSVYSGGNILVDGNTKIVLNQKYDLQKQLASLQLILEKAKIENEGKNLSSGSGSKSPRSGIEEISLIDLRFEKPVVRYVKKGS